jgi:hypothetical protein
MLTRGARRGPPPEHRALSEHRAPREQRALTDYPHARGRRAACHATREKRDLDSC